MALSMNLKHYIFFHGRKKPPTPIPLFIGGVVVLYVLLHEVKNKKNDLKEINVMNR